MDKNEKVRRALSLFRRRQTLFVIIYAAVNSLITVGIIVYYKLKEQTGTEAERLSVKCLIII